MLRSKMRYENPQLNTLVIKRDLAMTLKDIAIMQGSIVNLCILAISLAFYQTTKHENSKIQE